MEKIILSQQCPALKEACWNVHVDVLPAREVFELYEIKWRYVDHDRMSEDEKLLIRHLTANYGHGVMCV